MKRRRARVGGTTTTGNLITSIVVIGTPHNVGAYTIRLRRGKGRPESSIEALAMRVQHVDGRTTFAKDPKLEGLSCVHMKSVQGSSASAGTPSAKIHEASSRGVLPSKAWIAA